MMIVFIGWLPLQSRHSVPPDECHSSFGGGMAGFLGAVWVPAAGYWESRAKGGPAFAG